MAATEHVNGGWKNVIIGVLTSALLTFSIAWFSFGADVVRKDELKELNQTVLALQTAVASLTTAVAVLTERVGKTAK